MTDSIEKPICATCGIVMPISSIDGCGVEHWQEVKSIIIESVSGISGYEFTTRLVSDSDDIGIIQKRIIQNLYDSDIIVCDVSGKNPNVMFELGLRLAFDKATVIIKDDKTEYSFDTSLIEHVPYPRDLRFSKIVEFKRVLSEKVLATYRNSKNTQDYSFFLKSFGTFKVAKISEETPSTEKFMLETLLEIQANMNKIKRSNEANSIYNVKQVLRNSMEDHKFKILGNLVSAYLSGLNIKKKHNVDIDALNEEILRVAPDLHSLFKDAGDVKEALRLIVNNNKEIPWD